MPFELQPSKNHLYVFVKAYSELLVGLFLGVALCEGLLYWLYSESGKPSLVDSIERSPFSPHVILGTMWSVPFLAGAILWFSIWTIEQSERSHSRLTHQNETGHPPPPRSVTHVVY